jgi:antitoxin FitA
VGSKSDIISLKNDITAGDRMAQLIVRRLDDNAKERLKARAKRHGRSLEAEARAILEKAAGSEPAQMNATPGLGTRIARRFKGIGLTKSELRKLNKTIEVKRKERPRLFKFEP